MKDTKCGAENQALCSGFGQYHSPNNKKDPRQYVSVTPADIVAMLPNPVNVAKADAQWMIPSTLPSRIHAEQREHGRFYALPADIDETNGMTFKEIVSRTGDAILDFFAYTSRSATEENQKTRIIVPLAGPISGDQFVIMQKILNDKLELAGITPDRATERAGQVCYLPNRGEYYEYHIETFAGPMPVDAWDRDIAVEQERIKAAQEALQAAREQARIKATERMSSGCKSPIDAFNAEYSTVMMLDTYGYVQRGNRWLSPNSESGTPGVTITDDGRKWLSTHGSDAGIGRPTTNGTMGDAFDLFTHYQHGGNRNTAIKAAGDMFTVNGETLNQANQREYMQRQNAEDPPIGDSKKTFSLDAFAMNGDASAMEGQMLEDKFVLARMAILGQSTVFYARPNAGKTLLVIWLLIEAIRSGEINGPDIYFINADDTFKGLVYKLKLAEKHGFKMLAPGHKGFKSDQLSIYLESLTVSKTAKGKVLVLDTVKKFTDLMKKSKASEFGECIRRFVSHGGTVIMLAHVNKHRDDDNKVIYSGTTDLVDDADCAYTLDIILDDPATGLRTVRFENFKSRGDVAREVVYRYDYQDGTPYYDRLESVAEVGEAERKEAEKTKRLDKMLEMNRRAVDAILECLRENITQKTTLINEATDRSGLSKKQITKALADHTGSKTGEHQFWHVRIGERNTHSYALNYGVFEQKGAGV